jgi:pimeloyl-ACP methyl ester carboxylesterase
MAQGRSFSARAAHTASERTVLIPPIGLEGTLSLPADAKAVIVFAHGSGSSRFSPRNRMVAGGLNRKGLGTLLFDLLTEAEADDRSNVFDIPLLAERLMLATAWTRTQPDTAALPIGYFGASTGAAAALIAAARGKHDIGAVVSRGGRPDLAEGALRHVRAPTLLIVGGRDLQVLELNRGAHAILACEKALAIVPEATHLFEEPGALEEVVRLAQRWFVDHLTAGKGA